MDPSNDQYSHLILQENFEYARANQLQGKPR